MKVKLTKITEHIAEMDIHYVLIEWHSLRVLGYWMPRDCEYSDDYIRRYRLGPLIIDKRVPYKYRVGPSVERELDAEEEELLSQAMAKAVDWSAYLAEISSDPWRAR